MPVFATIGDVKDRTYGERVRLAREAKRPPWSQYDLAKELGWTRAKVASIEGEVHKVTPISDLHSIAETLEVNFDWLTGESEVRDIVGNVVRESHGPQYGALKAEETGKLKVYGAISAGDGNTGSIDPDEIDFPQQFARDDYGALWIEGDSMMVGERSGLMPSDLAIFRDWTREKVGRIMAAELPSGEWVVKELVYDDGRFKLRSLNERYPDIDGPFRLSGFLVGVVRDRGSRRHIILDTAGLSPDDLQWGE